MYAWEHEIRPSDILSQSSFENVVRYMMATGGSTNSLLHIPALARQADFDITPETFDAISREVPLLQHIYPNHLPTPWRTLRRRRYRCRGRRSWLLLVRLIPRPRYVRHHR